MDSAKQSNYTSDYVCNLVLWAAILGLWVYCSGCGFSTPGGYVAGTTGYLEAFYAGSARPTVVQKDERRY